MFLQLQDELIPQKHWQLRLGAAYSPSVWIKMERLGVGEDILLL